MPYGGWCIMYCGFFGWNQFMYEIGFARIKQHLYLTELNCWAIEINFSHIIMLHICKRHIHNSQFTIHIWVIRDCCDAFCIAMLESWTILFMQIIGEVLLDAGCWVMSEQRNFNLIKILSASLKNQITSKFLIPECNSVGFY